MKAVILVGGKGTRLLPLTSNIPKAMVPVLNVPLLEHIIRHLNSHHVDEIILALGHLPEPIREYFSDGKRLGVKIYYSYEDTPLGTAGALKNAERYLSSTFLALNGDSFTDLDITAMLEFHKKKQAKITIALTSVTDPTSYGIIKTHTDGKITGFIEKPGHKAITNNMINAGTYILEPEVLAEIPVQTKVSIEREVFPKLIAREKTVYGYSSSAYWLDVGTSEKYLQITRDLLNGKCQQHVTKSFDGILIGQHSNIHNTVEIQPPVLIGEGCSIKKGVKLIGPVTIGNGCTIEEKSILRDCIIWENVQIERNVEVQSSIVGNFYHLNANNHIENSVFGDDNAVLL